LKRQVRDPPADSRADISGGAQDIKVTGEKERGERAEEKTPNHKAGPLRGREGLLRSSNWLTG